MVDVTSGGAARRVSGGPLGVGAETQVQEGGGRRAKGGGALGTPAKWVSRFGATADSLEVLGLLPRQ